MPSGLHFFAFLLLHQFVDPHGGGQQQLLRQAMLAKPFGVLFSRFLQRGQPLVLNMPGDPEMHIRWRVEPDPRMPVITVVGLDERTTNSRA